MQRGIDVRGGILFLDAKRFIHRGRCGVADPRCELVLRLVRVNVVKDREGYQFIQVGWQEISVDGQAKVYKDIIEPLESISLNIYPTERESLKDIAPRRSRGDVGEASALCAGVGGI